MRYLLPILLAVAAACGGNGPTEVGTPAPGPAVRESIALKNETTVPFVVLAAGEGTLALLDIATTLPPGSYEDRLLDPGRTRAIPLEEIIGYDPKLGINFFLWRVNRTSGAAVLARDQHVSAAQLEAAGGLVRIKTLAP